MSKMATILSGEEGAGEGLDGNPAGVVVAVWEGLIRCLSLPVSPCSYRECVYIHTRSYRQQTTFNSVFSLTTRSNLSCIVLRVCVEKQRRRECVEMKLWETEHSYIHVCLPTASVHILFQSGKNIYNMKTSTTVHMPDHTNMYTLSEVNIKTTTENNICVCLI